MKFHRLLLVLAGAMAFEPARADTLAPPSSYRLVVPGGRYVFVMLAPSPQAEWELDVERAVGAKAQEIRQLRATYPGSGLYRNDDSAVPLWTVDWYAPTVHVASDGVHLVRPNHLAPRGEKARTGEAVAFFANGQLLRSYTVGDLVSRPDQLPQTAAYAHWCEKEEYDDPGLRWAVLTREGKRWVFDVRTGAVLSGGGSPLWVVVWVVAGLVTAAGAAWFWRYQRCRRSTNA